MAASRTISAVIPLNGTTSNSIDLDCYGSAEGLVGFVAPAAFTGASVTFNVSVDDTTYQQLFTSANSALTISITAAKTYTFTQDVRSELAPFRYIQIVSASSEAAARTFTLLKK